MNWSNHVIMNRNAPASKPAVNIADGPRQFIRPKWEKTFSSNKYQQRFSNRSYRWDSNKVNNTRLSLQQLSHTNFTIETLKS